MERKRRFTLEGSPALVPLKSIKDIITPSLQVANNCLLKLEALSCENCTTIFEGEKNPIFEARKGSPNRVFRFVEIVPS